MKVRIARGKTYQYIVRTTDDDEPIINTCVVGNTESGVVGNNMYAIDYSDLGEKILNEHERVLAKKALDKGWWVFADSTALVTVKPVDVIEGERKKLVW